MKVASWKRPRSKTFARKPHEGHYHEGHYLVKIAFFLTGTCLLLEGCAPHHLKPVCPALVSYSPADQKALTKELLQPGDHPQTLRWIGDYIGLRDQVRACQK